MEQRTTEIPKRLLKTLREDGIPLDFFIGLEDILNRTQTYEELMKDLASEGVGHDRGEEKGGSGGRVRPEETST